MKYWAFLSYSHLDKKWGDWLHKALETYRVPKRLIGQDSRDGKIPPRVYPIFRDREELPVSADLNSNIQEALRESRYLIVICSPNSARSRWVGEEIKTFKTLGKEDHILALIVGGEPNASDGKPGFKTEDECFPEPMRYRIAADGSLSALRTEPIAADVRESKDGKHNSKLKLIAGLIGVKYDDLRRRDQARRLRRARAFAAFALTLVVIFAALAVELFIKEREAQRARAAATDAQQQTILRASKADADIGLRLAEQDPALAFAHTVRALELNPDNTIAAVLAYRLLGDGSLTIPRHLVTHNSIVRAIAFSRDGRVLATGCDDGLVTVLDLNSGEIFRLADKFLASVAKVAFSPDGESVAIATGDEARQQAAIHIWQFRSQNKPALVSDKFTWGILELAWPTGNRIVAYSGRDWGSGDILTQVFGLAGDAWQLIFGFADSFVFEGDQESIEAIAQEPLVKCQHFQSWVAKQPPMLVVHDQVKRKLLWFDLRSTPRINNPLFSVNTNADDIVEIAEGTGVAIIGRNFTEEFQWRRAAAPAISSSFKWADPRSRTQGNLSIEGVTVDRISANGETLLGLDKNGAVVIDRHSGRVIGAVPNNNVDADDLLAISNDGRAVAIRIDSNRIVTVRFDDTQPKPETYTRRNLNVFKPPVALPVRVSGAAFDASGKWFASWTDDKNLRIWPYAVLHQKPICLSGGLPTSEDNSEDESFISTTEEATAGWRLKDEEVLRLNPTSKEWIKVSSLEEVDAYGPTGYSFSPDGSRVAVTYGSWSARPDNNEPSVAVLYDTATGKMIGQPLQHDDDVFSPCYAPNGKWFVTISDDRTVRRWDGKTGAAVGEPIRLPKARRFVRASADSKLVVTGTGHIIDAERWSTVKKLEPEPVALKHAFFGPDGSWCATVSTNWQPSEDSPWMLELAQWDLQNAVQIAEPIEIRVAESTPAERGGYIVPMGKYSAEWAEKALRISVGKKLLWQCTLPCAVKDILPFLKACRPLVLSETGAQTINTHCSLDALTMEKIFPAAENAQNKPAYEFARSVLTRAHTVTP